MYELFFEWDEEKNMINQQKHNISFEEAVTVFYNEQAVLFEDTEHSIDEERYFMVGPMKRTGEIGELLCVVCHCYRNGTDRIRIFSARKATRNEKDMYYKALGGMKYER